MYQNGHTITCTVFVCAVHRIKHDLTILNIFFYLIYRQPYYYYYYCYYYFSQILEIQYKRDMVQCQAQLFNHLFYHEHYRIVVSLETNDQKQLN